ncbi:Polyphenol oxidase protein [Dioscorea alata]|uniref:Polyphenol oxidase protein n=1 Tax=Dioscorea alata TaxID=55571 RepID=A0ACB7TVJ3_DIOAL|nr:Polyphenol oxidase protein [Dioscorea alata]
MGSLTIPSSFSSHTSFLNQRRSRLPAKRAHLLRRLISCQTLSEELHCSEIFTNTNTNTNTDSKDEAAMKIDRRKMLMIGLGGSLQGATGVARQAIGYPIQAPDFSHCQTASEGPKLVNCCLPLSSSPIIEFKRPSILSPLRVRPAAQFVGKEYLKKYRKAVELMRALPPDDPRSFATQAKIHCAYCNSAFDQGGLPGMELQVHNSWLFLPFHRCYIYFHERILGNLIGDPTFGLPFWNWDSPAGMRLPAFYDEVDTSLYDPLRDPKHRKHAVVDLDHSLIDDPLSDSQQIYQNLKMMYRVVMTNGKTPELFMGMPFRAGDNPNPGAGSLELLPHGAVHLWTGDRAQPFIENMGTFYSAARDPIFYAHHSNIDRMWSVWQKHVAKKTINFNDADWLETAFLLYDENARLVRIKVKDCLDTTWLRYTYQDVRNPWLNARPTPKVRRSKAKAAAEAAAAANKEKTIFPLTLSSPVSTTVKRPRVRRSKEEKKTEVEVLVVDGILAVKEKPVKFDVYVNAPNDFGRLGPEASEFAGCFLNPQAGHDTRHRYTLRLNITELVDEIGADGDGTITVTLVPRTYTENLEIGALWIEFLST